MSRVIANTPVRVPTAAAPIASPWSLGKATARSGGNEVTQWLQGLFGHYAGYVAGVILLVVALFVMWAFRQGRMIKLGPITFGAEKAGQVDEARGTGPGEERRVHSRDPRLADLARVYDVRDAARFYGDIAVNYDQRNSVNLLATHMEVITWVDRARMIKPELRVLDLGGGTGQNVATYFFNDPNIRWTYVDSCPAMVDQLQQHLAGRPMYERLRVEVDDINRVHQRLSPRSYDVVLLNLVLSSMPQLPDFRRIAGLVAAGGQLVVSDINPQYTEAHPYDTATAADGHPVAMRTRAVQPLEVVTRAREAGLQLSEMTEIGASDVSYSFIAVFASAVRPGDDPSSQTSDVLPA